METADGGKREEHVLRTRCFNRRHEYIYSRASYIRHNIILDVARRPQADISAHHVVRVRNLATWSIVKVRSAKLATLSRKACVQRLNAEVSPICAVPENRSSKQFYAMMFLSPLHRDFSLVD